MKYTDINLDMSIETPIYKEILDKYETIEYGIEAILNEYFHERKNKSQSSRNEVGLLTRTYNNYKGSLSYTREEFIEDISHNKKYLKLFKRYEESGFDKQLMPSLIMHPNLDETKIVTYNKRMKMFGKTKRRTQIT